MSNILTYIISTFRTPKVDDFSKMTTDIYEEVSPTVSSPGGVTADTIARLNDVFKNYKPDECIESFVDPEVDRMRKDLLDFQMGMVSSGLLRKLELNRLKEKELLNKVNLRYVKKDSNKE